MHQWLNLFFLDGRAIWFDFIIIDQVTTFHPPTATTDTTRLYMDRGLTKKAFREQVSRFK
jgi:hypothetical protein